MQRKEFMITMVAVGVLLAVTSGLWLATAPPANAQCGSQASSCKNCHEVQGQMPVNSDGTAWHTSHAFGDFCYICHAGNNQAMDINEAHTSMVPPLSDINASCLQCHPNDLTERAQVYATALGVEVGSVSNGESSNDFASNDANTETITVVTPLDVDDPNLVDFTKRYDEIVLGKRDINQGNVILIGLIGLVILGGSGLIIKNEKWLDFSSIDVNKHHDEYSADVFALLPAIAELTPENRKTLKKLLENPVYIEKVLNQFDSIQASEGHEEMKK